LARELIDVCLEGLKTFGLDGRRLAKLAAASAGVLLKLGHGNIFSQGRYGILDHKLRRRFGCRRRSAGG